MLFHYTFNPFPQFYTQDFTMSRDSLPTEAKTITMTGFNRLKINKDSLGKLHQFQSLTIEHINGIEMEPYALALPLCESIKGYSSIVINASTISNLKRRTLTGKFPFPFIQILITF